MGIYERIKVIADKRGLKIQDIEKGAGFPKGALSKMNHHSPSVSKLEKLADYLGVSVVEFLDEKQRPKYYLDEETAEIAQELHDNKDMRYLYDAMKGTNPETLKALVTTLEGMKKKEQYDGEDPC